MSKSSIIHNFDREKPYITVPYHIFAQFLSVSKSLKIGQDKSMISMTYKTGCVEVYTFSTLTVTEHHREGRHSIASLGGVNSGGDRRQKKAF
jgi:membrane-bound metal-dependent hydrolase YbcI (DUF457 family)